ncbi:MAG: chemotaxis protein CheW [Burkholderiales bacterium]|nr:chemotaxis protein CheW [Burkholderiales bacterium]
MRSLSKHADIRYLSKFMSGLAWDQERLREIQSVYDNLTLLGQLLCAGTDITGMRNDFSKLAEVLIEQLAVELRKKAVLGLKSASRVAIDILVRNLFERTADIGFLATDSDIRAFAANPEERDLAGLKRRFDEYVRKYSVYHDIILLSPEGEVLAQLSGGEGRMSKDPLVKESLATDRHYVETFRATDLFPGEAASLIYSYRVMSPDGSFPVGVLCLCFRLQDECERIFQGLIGREDWTVITLLDEEGRVIASSDPHQFPRGAKLDPVRGDECSIVRFAGREYLATTSETRAYQGYAGPGWVGHALAPLNHAFDMAVAHELDQVPKQIREGVLGTATLFSRELRDIPLRAASIQRELNRAVWNGNVWLSRENHALNASFAKVLLWEIGSTGSRTRNVFSQSTENLYETVLSSVLYDCASQASLAIDIMDRNLYERANDCRWWALTSAFIDEMRGGADRARLTAILGKINALYTVYTNILIFDPSGRVVAVSNPGYGDMVGVKLDEDWVRRTLSLSDSQRYCVSDFAPSDLYCGQETYVYCAAIRDGESPLGGVALVFDSAPQFAAMLEEALPRGEDGNVVEGAFAVFAERDGRIVASTDEHCAGKIEIGRKFLDLEAGAGYSDIVEYAGRYFAAGSRMSSGYREYKGEKDAYRNDIVAIVLVPLSDRIAQPGEFSAHAAAPYAMKRAQGGETVEIATFNISGNWYGLRSSSVLEAMDYTPVTSIPGMPAWVKGCILYRDQAIMVFDPACFLPGGGTSGKQIVVVRASQQQSVFGMLVDELGDIPEIESARLEPVPGMMLDTLTEGLVRPHPEDLEKRILVVLSGDRMLQKLTGTKRTVPQY